MNDERSDRGRANPVVVSCSQSTLDCLEPDPRISSGPAVMRKGRTHDCCRSDRHRLQKISGPEGAVHT